MRPVLRNLKFAWDYFVRGRHRLPPAEPLSDMGYPPVDESLMHFLLGMYQSHGAEAARFGNWVIVDRGKLLARASQVEHSRHPDDLVLRVDFITVTRYGHIVEAFAGVGSDLLAALKDACASFQDAAFHVLFKVLLGRPCEHVECEEWVINGLPRRITFGWVRMRGEPPGDQWDSVMAGLREIIQSHSLPGGLHWVRYFYFYNPLGPPTTELLVDNEICDTLQIRAAGLPWTSTEKGYCVRIFFAIEDAA